MPSAQLPTEHCYGRRSRHEPIACQIPTRPPPVQAAALSPLTVPQSPTHLPAPEESTARALTDCLGRGEFAAMLPLLEPLARSALGKLWSYRAYFQALPDELVDQSPAVCSALALLATLGGDVAGAECYIVRLRRMQMLYRISSPTYRELAAYLAALEVALPFHGGTTALTALKRLVQLTRVRREGCPLTLSVTANRPSIINGGRDYTAYGPHIVKIQGILKGFAMSLYGERGVGMVECALAEVLYQRDQTYDALLLLARTLPTIERCGDINILFVARALELYILTVSGQTATAAPLLVSLRQKLLSGGGEHLLSNLGALEAWAAMYDGDYRRVAHWLEHEAPDERGTFCTLDRFAYFVKLRVYLSQGRHLLLVALAERLRPVLVVFRRRMEQCELAMLLAMSHWAEGDRAAAFLQLEEALGLARRYRYDRLLADEGERLYLLLREYAAHRGEDPYLTQVTELCRKTALFHPNYLKRRSAFLPPLTEHELAVLRLMAAERSNAEIAEFLQISVNTVKFHSKNLFQKLEAASRREAVRIAREMDLL